MTVLVGLTKVMRFDTSQHLDNSKVKPGKVLPDTMFDNVMSTVNNRNMVLTFNQSLVLVYKHTEIVLCGLKVFCQKISSSSCETLLFNT